VYFSVINKTAF